MGSAIANTLVELLLYLHRWDFRVWIAFFHFCVVHRTQLAQAILSETGFGNPLLYRNLVPVAFNCNLCLNLCIKMDKMVSFCVISSTRFCNDVISSSVSSVSVCLSISSSTLSVNVFFMCKLWPHHKRTNCLCSFMFRVTTGRSTDFDNIITVLSPEWWLLGRRQIHNSNDSNWCSLITSHTHVWYLLNYINT